MQPRSGPRVMQGDIEQAIADGFKALSAGQPSVALEAVATIDADMYPRANLLVGHAHKALGQHAAAEAAYRALAAKPDRRHSATGWWSLAGLKTAQFSAADAARLDSLINGDEQDGYLACCIWRVPSFGIKRACPIWPSLT